MDRSQAASRPEGSPRLSITISVRTIWIVAGIVLLLIALGIVLSKGLDVAILLFLGIIIAEGIRPLVDWLHARRLPRPLAVLLIYVAAILLAAGLAWLLLQPLLNQISGLAANLPHFASQIQSLVERIQARIGANPQLQQAAGAAQGAVGGLVQGILGSIVQIPFLLAQLLLDAVVVLVIAFFWLTGVETLRPFFVGLFPPRRQPDVEDVLDEVQRKIGWYLRGVAINSIVVGVLSGAADWLIGAPYPLILGVLAGATELIPYFGPWISGGVAVLVTLLSGQVFTALLIVVAYVLIQQIEGHVLIPYVMMRVVEVNPLIVVLSTLLGFMLLGLIGGILAVPAASIIHVLMVRVVAPGIRGRTHREGEAAGGGAAEPAREAARAERTADREPGGGDFVVGPRHPAAT